LPKALKDRYTKDKENSMPQTVTMTLHEQLGIGMKVLELEKQGKKEEARELEHTIPLPSYLAKWTKKRLGADFLIQTGWNLSEAEAEYGSDWLTR
jgi:hypothetical protein